MIAKNFLKFPEALRFQREMFSNGYKNQPRSMRRMQCIFDQRPGTPEWLTCAKGKARDLAKQVKKAIMALFEKPEVMNQKKEKQKHTKPNLTPYFGSGDKKWHLGSSRAYRLFCPTKNHAFYKGGFEYRNDEV